VSAAPGAALLSARGLGKRYGEREALRGVDLDAHAGELVAVIGPNGAGKTTLLSILAGVQAPSAGTLRAAAIGDEGGEGDEGDEGGVGAGGEDGAGGKDGEPVRIGWVPQQAAVYTRLTVAENLELFARLEHVRDTHARVAEMLEQTGLRERAGERVGRLSGGNRQRVNIALGLLADPAVLVLDEPSSSLDPRQRERLWRFVLESSGRGRAVVFSTHNVAEAERYAQRVLVLADGELLFSGTPAELAHAAGSDGGLGFEGAFVQFLRARGH
jgi:ABC-2 type transport system ATP-binding protein